MSRIISQQTEYKNSKDIGNRWGIQRSVNNGISIDFGQKIVYDDHLKYSGYAGYKAWQGNPGLNVGETKMDRIYRFIGNSRSEIANDFAQQVDIIWVVGD